MGVVVGIHLFDTRAVVGLFGAEFHGLRNFDTDAANLLI